MSASVAIFWDYENCALPALEPSYTIVNRIRRLAHQYGSVKAFKAYLEYPEQLSPKSLALRSELQSCGVSLIDCPHNGRKDVADKMMMVDMMAHAIDTPAPATIILISGDRDFVYAVSVLSLRQYRVVLLAPRAAHSSLKAQAHAVYHWPDQFLPELPPANEPISTATQYGRPSRSNPTTLDDFWKGQCATPPPTASVSSEPLSDANTVEGRCGMAEPVVQFRETASIEHDEVRSDYVLEESASLHIPEKLDGAYVPNIDHHQAIGVEETNPSPIARCEGSERSELKPTSPVTWASVAQLHESDLARTTSPIRRRSTISESKDDFASDSITSRHGSSIQGLNALAPAFVLNTTLPTNADAPNVAGDGDGNGSDWQTYTRAAKKRPVPALLPFEFKPLVKVLKRQLAEGVVHVESSQLGQFLSQEVPRLGTIYERAGVTRLKEYTALAAERGIVTVTREGGDGHNYVALHPAHRRKAATLG